jgi:hypothetical protein
MGFTAIVVPCYNEGSRLETEQFLAFIGRHPAVRFLFVNDGSTDNTLAVLHQLQERARALVGVLDLPLNQGKAEAVRQGCLAGFANGAARIGYWDADLATPLQAIPDFLQVLAANPQAELVCGARVQLLGRSIRRRRIRHYLGRVFATAASWTLGLAIYDTQCGAKLFRASPLMQAVLSRPFLTRWLFDVEILARLVAAGRSGAFAPAAEVVHELPLQQWHDIPGSKVKPTDFPKALMELMSIYRAYLRGNSPWPDRLAAAAPAPAATVLHFPTVERRAA